MSDQEFSTDLVKMIAAELYFLCGLQASQALFGKGYFQLSVAEKIAVDKLVFDHVSTNFGPLTPEFFRGAGKGSLPMGFQPASTAAPSGPQKT